MASPKTRPALKLTIVADTASDLVPFIRSNIRKSLKLIRNCRLTELNIALVGSPRMSEVHREFLGINEPTDVITFPIEHDAQGRATSGEIVICVPVARAQAKRRNIPAKLEVLLYAIHGMLHLCGHDDRTAADFQRMHRTEDRILNELGLGTVFHASER